MGGRVPVRNRTGVSDEIIRQSSASLIFAKLRKMIASDTQPTDNILGAIAVAAHSLTGATGAAVAMPRDGVVVCVGRSGETAPELGARLNVDSGISGECLRTGVIMRCEDASRDFHVDAEVCRQLGLQSIAAVPLRGQFGRVGVLEAFSTESYAFTEDKMEVLGRLAGLAEAAWARGMVVEVQQDEAESMAMAVLTDTVDAPAEQALPAPAAVPLAKVRELLASARLRESRFPRKLSYPIFAGAALAVLLLSVYGWKAWYRSSIASTATRPAATVPTASAAGGNAGVGAAPNSSGGMVSKTLRVPKAGDVEIRGRAVRRSVRPARPANRGMKSGSLATGEEIPQLAASNADPADLGKALATAPTLPQLGVPISQGITGGVLMHKVQPVYPPEARRMHVQGSVVIDATVTPQGQVDELKLVSGDPLLAPAAMDAVRRWRYTPYSLNGQPIAKETRITISFIAAQ
jgi:periplasmic protein TonB